MAKDYVSEVINRIDEEVKLKGWVHARRDHGQVLFVDLRDSTGLIQIVFSRDLDPELFQQAELLKDEMVVSITGSVIKREERYINKDISTGEIEIKANRLEVINETKELPFPIDTDGIQIDELTRLKYRYLDLRRWRLHANLELRNRVTLHIRNWMEQRGFLEIETPCLSKATPEGSRDFIVPSRLQQGNFYALPQAPQQYKQLLMVAGFERYFQIARVFRDEDPRADRAYGEYTQVDIEISFCHREEVIQMVESLVIDLVESVTNKKIKEKPFPRIPYQEAMQVYGADRFDLREQADPETLAFAWVVDFPLFEETETREISPAHNPFTAPKPEDIPLLDQNPMKARSQQYDLVCNGYEVAGGAIRITDPKLQAKIFKILGHREEDIERKFGHLIKAFQYGVPPHGGIALSLERFMMVFANEPNTREVTAFPMTSGGRTAVMDAPSEVDTEQLSELGITVVKSK